ncbi:MAG: carboxypeptidase regulatory-like domain-containing protein [Bacteroidota bacterium]
MLKPYFFLHRFSGVILLPVLLLVFLGSSCAQRKGAALSFKGCTNTVQQGFEGSVKEVSGNMMPGPGVIRHSGTGLETDVYIFELTKAETLEKTGADSRFYKMPKTKLIAKGKSDKDGCFRVALPAGRYSVFVNVPGNGLFANRFDGENNVFPCEVLPDALAPVEIKVDYKAAY